MSFLTAENARYQQEDFGSIIQTCSSNIHKINQNTSHMKSLLQQLGTQQETSTLQDRLQELQQDTNQLVKETNRNLKELGSPSPFLSVPEQRQQKLQKERLMNDFSSSLNSFQVVQRKAAEKEKESVVRARAGSRAMGDGANADEPLITFENEGESGWCQTQSEMPGVSQEDLETIKEKETNIKQLETDIMDVNQIFKDLAMMIHAQGQTIDSIEAHVDRAEIDVDRGAIQLQQAAYYQRKSRKKICVLSMVLSVVLIILLIIIWKAV